MDKAETWQHVHRERAAFATTLADLDPDEWQRDSLCAGWTVHDVAAHVISTPAIGWREMAAMTGRNLGRGYNTMIFREAKRAAARSSPERVLADFDQYAASTHHVPVTTSVEPLIDNLLHHQDVVRPLGRTRAMDPAAAVVAAERLRLLAPLMGTGYVVRTVRLVATDVDWSRGRGPAVRGPVQELLMLLSGRAPDPDLVEGDGLAALAARKRRKGTVDTD